MSSFTTAQIPNNFRKAARKNVDLFVQESLNNKLLKDICYVKEEKNLYGKMWA